MIVDLPHEVPCRVCGARMVETVPEPGVVWALVCPTERCPYALRLRVTQ